MKKFLSVFVTVVFCLSLSVPAQALSCAVMRLNAEAIEQTAIIFEGVVEKEEIPGFIHYFKESKDRVYTFRITKLWKGEHQGDTIKILAPPGWAQERAYIVGKEYMVFGNHHESVKGQKDTYYARPGWCGYDINGIEANRTALKTYSKVLDE